MLFIKLINYNLIKIIMSIPLKKTQENRVNQLINYHSKSQNGTITYSEVISLLICQGILNKSINFKTIH